MSALALPPELRAWNAPPVHSVWRSFAPVFLLDGKIYWQNKKGLESVYGLGDHIEDFSEEDIEEIAGLLSDIAETIDGYLRIRGSGTALLKKIGMQRHALVLAVDAIKRGYAPGRMPSDEERIALANNRLREIGIR